MVESVPLASDRSSDGLSARPRPNSSPRKCAAWGMKQGPELLHKIVSAHVAIHRDAAMASVDVKNAHDAVEWGAIQSEIEALDKNIWKWCVVLFKAGHELTCSSTTVISSPTPHHEKGTIPGMPHVEPHLPLVCALNRFHCGKPDEKL